MKATEGQTSIPENGIGGFSSDSRRTYETPMIHRVELASVIAGTVGSDIDDQGEAGPRPGAPASARRRRGS